MREPGVRVPPKGVPPGFEGFDPETVGSLGWSLLRGDLSLPAAVLKEDALRHNSRWMQRFVALHGAVLAPHGKTTMSPELFRLQLEDGAWGITVATPTQAAVAREAGVSRILMANQLVDPHGIRWVLDELRRDPDFDFYCVVDSVAGVRILDREAAAHPAGRPLQVLVEGGFEGGRTGCRTVECALDVARAVRDAAPRLALRGVEGYEGLFMLGDADGTGNVDRFLARLVAIAGRCEEEGLFADGPLVLTAGGSAYFDRVLEELGRAGVRRDAIVVNRSGCYLTHDSGFYEASWRALLERSPAARELEPGLRPALELWAWVQSRPEPGLALLTLGKRDASFDSGMPTPLAAYRPGADAGPRPLGDGFRIDAMNDQHAYLRLPEDADLAVGDMVACGISHPCLTFDRWPVLFLVDDAYEVTGAVRTVF